MTYAQILSLFNLKLDKETNAYFSNTEIATILNEALYRLLEDRYRAFESSNRIAEQISPLIKTVGKQLSYAIPFVANNSIGWESDWSQFNSDTSEWEFTGWLHILNAKLTVRQADVTYSASAVETTSAVTTQANQFTTQVKKLNINAENLTDPYLEGSYTDVGSHKLQDLKIFYKSLNKGILLCTRQTYGTNQSEDFLGSVWANTSDTVTLSLTVIQKPIEFTDVLLEGAASYEQLNEPGIRDLVDYAIQVANEVTRDKEGYQFISSQIQKDLI
jgi:hypothetical protein